MAHKHPNRIPFYNSLDATHPKIWPGHTLVMPTCAVGNIGQLACDLLISTLLDKDQCKLVGRIYSPALMSVSGPNAFASKGPPTTSTEVYESREHKVVIVQQRTSYFKELKVLYIKDLVQWIKEARFDRVLVLSSSFEQCNPDTSTLGNLSSCSIRSITTRLFEKDSNWTRVNLKPVPERRTAKVVRDGLTYLPGSGLTKPLIKAFEQAFIPAAFLVDFRCDGVNMVDGYQVANVVDQLLDLGCAVQDQSILEQQQDITITCGDRMTNSRRGWIEPFSWTRALDKDLEDRPNHYT